MKRLKIIAIALTILLVFVISYAKGYYVGYGDGYCQALVDHKEDRPLKYRLEKRDNGGTVWVRVSL